MATTDIAIDPWTYYDFKEQFRNATAGSAVKATWIGDNRRRLEAYKLLEAYCRNAARNWLNIKDEERRSRREYGDPNVIVATYVSSIMGDGQVIMVAGAESDDAADNEPGAVAQLDILLQWRKDELYDQKLLENERQTAKLGDGVYVIDPWDEENERPRLYVYDPGFYFPVLTDEATDQYPGKIHIAWEYKAKGGELYVRRKTWELRDIPEEAPEDFEPIFPENVGDDGVVTRNYPWNSNPSTITCFYSDGTWPLKGNKDEVDDLDPRKATWDVFERDLQIDFIPVVHTPNTVAGAEHFGTSVLATPIQVFDDLIATDTDLQASSATTGSPPIAVKGASLPRDDKGRVSTYGPGQLIETGDGEASMIDTSTSLDALLKYDDHMLERLSVNSRVPEALLGRVKPNEVPSGIALTLSFTPHGGAVSECRLARNPKNALVLKFISRCYMRAGELTKINPVALAYGSFLPSDKQEASTLVAQLYRPEKPIISLETAIRILMNAGFPIEDAVEEINRIIHNDFKSADDMLTATGDINVVRERLGLPPVVQPEPVPPVPPTA